MKAMLCVPLVLILAVPLTWGDNAEKAKKATKESKAIYDEKADGKAQIAAALAAAKRENRRVLIQWGGNWCSWCILLDQRFRSDKELARILHYEYDMVHIDSINNQALAEKYGAIKNHGVPFLTVLDSSGKVLVNQPTEPFETNQDGKKGHDPKKLKKFLTAHQAPPLDAEKVLRDALVEARKSERSVFLHFGAPWCGWCLRLDAWVARPEVAALLRKDYVEVKIDLDRMKGGKDVLARFNASSKGGIPWFVMLDAKGNALVSSDGPKGNIGFPATDQEIAYFVKMLDKSRNRLSDKEIEELSKSLTAAERQRQAPLRNSR
jgi:thiol-disulfide isomerase/thioredoxin